MVGVLKADEATASVSLVLNVEPQPANFNTYWCKNNARL
jgi:hypothetical protein